MNLNEILNIFNLILGDRLPHWEDLTPERFTDLLKNESIKLFELEIDREKIGNLRPFKRVMGGNDVMPMVISKDGTAEIPDSYKKCISIRHHFLDGGIEKDKICRMVDDQLWDILASSATEFPTKNYPIANEQNGYIRFLPVNLRYVVFTYFKYPVDPVFAYTAADGYIEYLPSTSTELEWDLSGQIVLIQMMAKTMGVKISVPDVEKVVEQKSIKK